MAGEALIKLADASWTTPAKTYPGDSIYFSGLEEVEDTGISGIDLHLFGLHETDTLRTYAAHLSRRRRRQHLTGVHTLTTIVTERHKALVDRRLRQLRAAAGEEGIPWNDLSVLTLHSALAVLDADIRPRLTLRSSGNLRALWENADGRQVAFECINLDAVNYVMLKSDSKDVLSSHYGTCSLRDLHALVDALDMSDLLRGDRDDRWFRGRRSQTRQSFSS